MDVQNFVFRENQVGSKVAGIKTTVFKTTWTNSLTPESPNKEFLKEHLVKKNKTYIIINVVTLRLTN